MSLVIHLLGLPRIAGSGGQAYVFRSRKSWALLAYLILTERPPSRGQLASLLFAEADDPARALRWSLTEIRRALGDDATVDGDPVILRLSPDAVVDTQVVTKGVWSQAVELPGLGSDLLEGMAIKGAAAFDTWLLSMQRHIGAASEAILHEAALGSMSRGALDAAIGYAVRAARMSPFDENHHALLIRLYRMAGDEEAAARQFETCVTTLRQRLGTMPGPAVAAAMREPRHPPRDVADETTISAILEAGSAAISAGAVEAGLQSLRSAVGLADGSDSVGLRINSRLVLAEALIHSLGGLDEAGMSTLFEADEIASTHGNSSAAAQARAELGYVDFLRGRYDRAEVWLTDALRLAEGSASMRAKALAYLGSVESDRSSYRRASALLEQAITLSRTAREPRREAFGLAMLGRVALFQDDLDAAVDALDASIRLAEREHWLAYLPWPQALRGEVELARGDLGAAAELLQQAFARACQVGDPCYEGMSARGLAFVAEANGEPERAFALLSEARRRASRLADPYVWLDGYILDAQCELGRRHRHADTKLWVEALRALASRTGMRGFALRSLVHGAALGNHADADAAVLLAADIEAADPDPAEAEVVPGRARAAARRS